MNEKVNPYENRRTIFCLFIILTGLILMNFSCNDCEEELHDRSSYSVALNYIHNTISIGDTISLNTSMSSQIELDLSGSIHDNYNQLINYRIKVFEARFKSIDVIEARDNFKFVGQIGNVYIPPSRNWEVMIENSCDENLCELELGIIPQQIGYFGISLQTGGFGFENECEFLTLIPAEIQLNGSNNFELLEEINLSSVRINGSFYRNPAAERLLYFFKVIE